VTIHDGLTKVVEDYAGRGGVEATFVNKDANATLKLGQAGHRAADSGARGDFGRRIRAQPGEEDHRRRRPLREGADQADAPGAAAKADPPTHDAATRLRLRCATPTTQSAALALKVKSAGLNVVPRVGVPAIRGNKPHDRKVESVIDSYGEDFIVLDVHGVATWCIARRARCRRCPPRARR